MHVKRIHEMVEKLTEAALCELNKGIECVDTEEFGEVIDAIKDLCAAEKDALISKEMKEYKEEEEAEEKYMMRMLKDEHKDEYKRMREEYGEDEGERRFYDNYRYANGRFAPRGRGSYMPERSGRRGGRRGYEEPMYHMSPDMYHDADAEYYRDLDRHAGRLYYSPGNMGGMGGNRSGGSMNSGSGGRSYYDGDGRGNESGGGRPESRYDRARRGYEEAKMAHNGNTPEDKRLNMAEMEKVLNVVFDEIDEMLEDASPEVKNMVKSKGLSRFQKIS